MRKARVLFVSQEIVPFLPETTMSSVCRHLPQGIHDKGKEIRVFTPRFGKINERRHQLHEVIRLSGMNMIINDSDHPLIIKVASIPTARMQVYFIDNEEFFHRKAVTHDDSGDLFPDNDERSIFFVRGVLETVRKLGWAPDIIHCHGWMTALLPLYVKKLFNQDPHFSETKVVYSSYDQPFGDSLNENLQQKIEFDGIDKSNMPHLEVPTLNNLHKTAISYADAVINGSQTIDPEIESFISSLNLPFLDHGGNENYISEIDQFYDGILEGKSMLVEEP